MTSAHPDPTCDRFAEWLADRRPASGGPHPFETHLAGCAACRDLQDAAAEGARWLRELPGIEPSETLIQSILAATAGGAASARRRPLPKEARVPPSWWAEIRAFLALAGQPRLAMTGAMAFFSLSLIANVTGASLADVRQLSPAVLVGHASLRYYQATAGVVRYYENNRFVRELEAEIRDLRDAASDAPADETAPDERETESHG